MNRYLMERLETTRLSPSIENLVFVSAEAMRENDSSEAFQRFLDTGADNIRKTLKWNDSAEVEELIDSEIKDKTFAYTMTRYHRDGFLAEVYFSEPFDIRFDESGKPFAWSSGSVSLVHWIYADSVGELIEKIIKKDEEEFKEAINKAKQA